MIRKLNRPLRITPIELVIFFACTFGSGLLIAIGVIKAL